MNKIQLQQEGLELGLNKNDIETIILHNTGLSKSQYFLVDNIDNPEQIIADFSKIGEGYPIQYITNRCEFYARKFYVDKDVLIPRIDTELFVDILRKKDYKTNSIYIDVGTGSGIIPITFALEFKTTEKIYAIDISDVALGVARKNIEKYHLENDIILYNGSLLSDFQILNIQKESHICITANLPYIKKADYRNMSESTIMYEPDEALYGGENTGFEMYEKLIFQCINISQKGYEIVLFIEIGFDQRDIATNFLQVNGLDFEFYKDSATIERVVEIHF